MDKKVKFKCDWGYDKGKGLVGCPNLVEKTDTTFVAGVELWLCSLHKGRAKAIPPTSLWRRVDMEWT